MSRGSGEGEYVLADVPGLIEGASHGHGLGLQFLKHIERTRGLLYVLDLFAGGFDNQKALLEKELGAFSPVLLEKSRILVGSKADIADKETVRRFQAGGVAGARVVVSSVTGQGIEDLRSEITRMMEGADEG
jgi:GTP-binding protein